MTKRKKFIIGASVLSLILLTLSLVPLEYKYVGIFGFFLITYIVSAWALWDDLKGVEWITILLLPSLYSMASGLFYFLLPDNAVSTSAIIVFFGVGMYALYLTENIYSVAANRTIQLVRAANAVGFLMSVITLVLLYNTLYSFRFAWWGNGLGILTLSFPILLQGLWSVNLKKTLTKDVTLMSLGLSVAIALVGIVMSFMPTTVWIASLLLSTLAYVSLGLLQHALDQRLFERTIYEYLLVGIFVIVATFVVMPWRG